jgi:hypothetical protein
VKELSKDLYRWSKEGLAHTTRQKMNGPDFEGKICAPAQNPPPKPGPF